MSVLMSIFRENVTASLENDYSISAFQTAIAKSDGQCLQDKSTIDELTGLNKLVQTKSMNL